MASIDYNTAGDSVIININMGAKERDTGGGTPAARPPKLMKVIWYDAQGDSIVLDVLVEGGNPVQTYRVSGFAATREGIVELDWKPITVDVDKWKLGAEWTDQGPGTVPDSVRHTFKNHDGKKWIADVIASDDETKHWIALTAPDGNSLTVVTYDNAVPAWVVAVGIAAAVCLVGSVIAGLILDCKEECGGTPKKIEVGIRFSDSFPYLPICTKTCICR